MESAEGMQSSPHTVQIMRLLITVKSWGQLLSTAGKQGSTTNIATQSGNTFPHVT